MPGPLGEVKRPTVQTAHLAVTDQSLVMTSTTYVSNLYLPPQYIAAPSFTTSLATVRREASATAATKFLE